MLNVNRVAKSNIDRSWFRASRRSLEMYTVYIQTLRHTISRENELVIVRAREVNTDIIFVVSRCRARRKKRKKEKERRTKNRKYRRCVGENGSVVTRGKSFLHRRNETLHSCSVVYSWGKKGGFSLARYGRSTFSPFSLPANRKTNRGKIKKLK